VIETQGRTRTRVARDRSAEEGYQAHVSPLTIAGEGRDGGGGLGGKMSTGIAQIELSGRRDSALAFGNFFSLAS
jgi:hypothetical protein